MDVQSMRIEYGKYLVELGYKNQDIVVLEADLKESTQSVHFQKSFPHRYFDMGVAEQNMIGVAAGLSLSGKIPMVHSFACFISMRACEQVRTTVAYPDLNVKLIGTHAGISTGTAGTTHHAIEDIAIMRAIPNMTVLVPGDVEEMKQSVEAAIVHRGPVYIRLPAGDAEDIYGNEHRFSLGRATMLREGNDLCLITTGTMMACGVKAADQLAIKGIKARVMQMACVKPLDRTAVQKAAVETGLIITIEEHNTLGGLGGAVCEIAAEVGHARVKRIGINNHFLNVGTADFLLEENGLTVHNILRIVDNQLLPNKKIIL